MTIKACQVWPSHLARAPKLRLREKDEETRHAPIAHRRREARFRMTDRRSFVQRLAAAALAARTPRVGAPAVAAGQSVSPRAAEPPAASAPYRRIATEEAWAPPELMRTLLRLANTRAVDDPGFVAMWSRLGARAQLIDRLTDVGERRIADMDAAGVDVQILSLTSPGVQIFDAPTATALARESN